MNSSKSATITAGIFILSSQLATAAPTPVSENAILYKNPNCGCCDDYTAYLESKGMNVDIVASPTLSDRKAALEIPSQLYTCHTLVAGDYVIEGHVPFAAIDKLFNESPEVDGVGLAGMPLGSPGMPGQKQAPFVVMSFAHQAVSPFATL